MIIRQRGVALILSPVLFVPAFGQTIIVPRGTVESGAAAKSDPSRVLAGLHAYPPQIVEALRRVAAEEPQLLERAADAVREGRDPRTALADERADLGNPFELLALAPGVLVLAAERADQLQELRSLWADAPDQTAQRLAQLQQQYEHAAREAAQAWQRALQSDPVAFGQYRDLLTRFCQLSREIDPGFACVRVVDRRYYYACPPHEELIAFASEEDLPPALRRILSQWWSGFAPQRVDERITLGQRPASSDRGPGPFLVDWPAEGRAAMWQSIDAGGEPGDIGMVPVILQPPTDQPPGARLAFALTEHARLWSAPEPPLTLEDAFAADEPVADAEGVTLVVEEAIPGPLTARYEEDLEYREAAYRDRYDYAYPRYGYSLYGYSRYYCDPFYLPHYAYSVYYPSAVCYSGIPSSRGDHARHHVRISASRRHRFVACDGRGQRGGITISIGGQHAGIHSRSPQTTPCRTHSARGNRLRSARGLLSHDVFRHSLVGRSGRSETRTGAIRSGSGTFRIGSRTVRSGSRAIHPAPRTVRSGIRPTRSSLRTLHTAPRTSGRAIRSSSRSGHRGFFSSGRSRSGGGRRR